MFRRLSQIRYSNADIKKTPCLRTHKAGRLSCVATLLPEPYERPQTPLMTWLAHQLTKEIALVMLRHSRQYAGLANHNFSSESSWESLRQSRVHRPRDSREMATEGLFYCITGCVHDYQQELLIKLCLIDRDHFQVKSLIISSLLVLYK